jgi:multicomponent K+:H+ antiporter subunit A
VFLLEPAPDVALVQFLVETIGTVLLIMMLAKIDPAARQRAIDNVWSSSRKGVMRDVLISTLVGTGMALFALAAVMHRPSAQTITLWHMEHAKEYIGIPDIVGAIVTDFRGMDTVIEITVFGMAALGVMTLLMQKKEMKATAYRPLQVLHNFSWHVVRVKSAEGRPAHDDDHEDLPAGSNFSTPMTRTIATIVLPFALLLALAQLIYGGDGPGDGFTAGVTSGLGVALWYIVFGYAEARQRLAWLHPRRLIGAGILLVVLNGAAPMLFGYPFLAHVSLDFIPLPANIHISTTFLFETGIFLTVFGSSALVLGAISHPAEVEG